MPDDDRTTMDEVASGAVIIVGLVVVWLASALRYAYEALRGR